MRNLRSTGKQLNRVLLKPIGAFEMSISRLFQKWIQLATWSHLVKVRSDVSLGGATGLCSEVSIAFISGSPFHLICVENDSISCNIHLTRQTYI